MAEHKGHEATPKKLKEARKKGSVIKSTLLTSACVFAAILLSVFKILPLLWIKNQQMLEWCLSVPSERTVACTLSVFSQTFLAILGSLVLGVIVALLLEVAQVKVQLYWEPLRPQFSRINPASLFKKISQGFLRSLVCFVKLSLIIILAKSYLLELIVLMKATFFTSVDNLLGVLLPEVIEITFVGVFVLLFFGLIEYFINRWRFIKEQSMSLDEIRREFKEEEGDPHLKAHVKSMHECILMQEMIKRIRDSKVIIVD